MTADANQEDLSMEEILSSIRNILIEDGTPPQAGLQEAAPLAQDEVEDLGEQDSIFDLSQDMIVEEKPVFEYTKIVDSATDQDADPIDIDSLIAADDDLSIETLAAESLAPQNTELSQHEQEVLTEDEEQSLTEMLVDDLEVDLVEETAATIEENLTKDILDAQEDDLVINLNDELEHELLAEPDPKVLAELHAAEDETLMPSFGTELPTSTEPFAQEPTETVIEPEPILDDVEDLSILEDPAEPEIKAEPDPEPEPMPEAIDTSSDPIFDESLPDVVSEPEVSAELTSENILNEFASIFAQDQQRKIFETVAREEISDLTKAWLEKNLPSIVTDIVKKEVARVMARVGK